jgi:hypothetical protein
LFDRYKEALKKLDWLIIGSRDIENCINDEMLTDADNENDIEESTNEEASQEADGD